MTSCSSSCPHGDCANCVGFDRRARCEPVAQTCRQVGDCARACQSAPARVIDASVSLSRMPYCQLYLDKRGAELVP